MMMRSTPQRGPAGGLDGGDAAIDGDDEFGASVGQLADGVRVQPVPLFEPVGDVGLDRRIGGDVCESV